MVRRYFNAALTFLMYVVIFDVIGLISGVFFANLLSFIFHFVLGVLCGSMAYAACGEMLLGDAGRSRREDAVRAGTRVIVVAVLCLSALGLLAYLLALGFHDFYFSLSPELMLTFFGAILATMVFMRYTSKPS